MRRLLAALALLPALPALAAPASAACRARSADGAAATVVELYTSEGCNACPPADRWLSSLAGRPGVVALAFHVDYWDRLGWADRFASPAFTQRQFALQRAWGARFAYTPQVVADGADWRRWPGALPPPRPATVAATLERTSAQRVEAVVRPLAGAPSMLEAYWAVVEDGHESAVRAGENAGVTLRHDHVVRRHVPAAPWRAAQGEHRLALDVAAAPTSDRQRVVLVVGDAATHRPVQALSLGC
jgi:hypothetical protein